MNELFIDISQDQCPITYVKVKLRLETMQPGQQLTILLRQGEPLDNVPQSLKEDGYPVSDPQPTDQPELFQITTIKPRLS
ncbi:sulfurtransferase TusA family protein [Magnetococcus sp. PR-3]|uniref:sulfurtransferase TusA family protein n=1 Tax=Magnetococcus sp. PR-3 TaxID=3120355 RepID=UPI002FCE0E7D